jgi:hypothetical protein
MIYKIEKWVAACQHNFTKNTPKAPCFSYGDVGHKSRFDMILVRIWVQCTVGEIRVAVYAFCSLLLEE